MEQFPSRLARHIVSSCADTRHTPVKLLTWVPSRELIGRDHDLGCHWYAETQYSRVQRLQRNAHLGLPARMMARAHLGCQVIRTSYAPGLRASEGHLAHSRSRRAGGDAGHRFVVLRRHCVERRRLAPGPGAGRRPHVGRRVVARLSKVMGRSFVVGEGCRRRMVPRTLQWQ
jgi:peptidoglycan/xylan/chitin deacetylase (PgdA/CDA1 family)